MPFSKCGKAENQYTKQKFSFDAECWETLFYKQGMSKLIVKCKHDTLSTLENSNDAGTLHSVPFPKIGLKVQKAKCLTFWYWK